MNERRDGQVEHGRQELLTAIEDADDLLVEALGLANESASRGGIRPTTHAAFAKLEEAQNILAIVDETRVVEGDDE